MIKNIISYVIPFGGLLILFFSFHYLDKYAKPTPTVEEQLQPEENIEQ